MKRLLSAILVWLAGTTCIWAQQPAVNPDAEVERLADTALAVMKGSRIGLVGEHPLGFDTCRYEPADLDKLIAGAGTLKLVATLAKSLGLFATWSFRELGIQLRREK